MSLKQTRTLTNGNIKTYEYKSIAGTPIEEYRKQHYHYTPRPKKLPKYKQIPEPMQKEILRLQKHGLGYDKIWLVINDDPRFHEASIGQNSIRKLIKDAAISTC